MGRKNNSQIDTSKAEVKKLKPLIHYMRPYKAYIIYACLALLVTSSSVLGLGKGVGYLVDEGLGGNNPALLNNALLALLCITALLSIGTYARFYFITFTGERVVADIRRDIYSHILSLSPEFFEKNKVGDILSRITTDTTLLQMVVGSSLSVALRNIIMLFGGFILLLHTSLKLTAIVAVIVPIVVVPIVVLGKRLRKLSKESQDRISTISSHAEESINGIKTIQAFVREGLENKVFLGFVDDALLTASERIKIRSLLTAIVIMFVFGSIGFVLWVGGNDVLKGSMSAGELSSFIFYSIVVAGSTGAISEVIGELQRAAGASERIMELLHVNPDIKNSRKAIEINKDLAASVEFNDVTFKYPSQVEKKSLVDFNLRVEDGETVAVVGPSGAGKSTIFQLLLRFYEPEKGSLKIGGINIADVKLNDLRSVFGIVPQDSVIFSGTAYDNILFGNPDASKEQVYKAAEAASAMEFIKKLPDGFNSFLGEKGVRLSGGERQRIAIARVFLKNPKILLLDEATSALDAKNEQLVQQSFEKLMEGRTTIVIAHRLSTVKKADRIVVIDNGRIEEIGSHDELIKKKGLYSKLVKVQFDS